MYFRKTIERTCIGKRFVRFFIDRFRNISFRKIKNIFKITTRISFFDQCVCGRFASSFYSTQSKTDFAIFVYIKIDRTLVHIWAQYFYPNSFRFFEEISQFFDVVFFVRKVGCHVFGRIVGFEPSRLEGHKGITSRVRFVEGIGGKGFPVGPNFLQFISRMSFCRSPFNKLRF